MYCSASDIEGKLGFASGTFTGSSKPTLAQVNAEITNITSEIDMILESIGISLPITDSNVLNVVEQKCILGAAGMVRLTYYDGDSENVEGTQGDRYYKLYEKFLADIVKNPSLVGVSADATNIITGNQVTDGTYDESDLNLIDQEFTF